MTQEELHEEWKYRYQERLGLLCGTRPPTDEEDRLARVEANAAIAGLVKEQSEIVI